MLRKWTFLLLLFSVSRILYAQEHRIIVVPVQNKMLILDRFHRAFDKDDMEENAVYVLRNTLVRELLQTRKELKYFIGGVQRAREIALDDNLNFELDRSVCNLYLENCDADSINIEAERIGQTGTAMFVRTPLYEIHQAISDIYLTKIDYDVDVRIKLVLGLIHLSALLTKLDRYIIYFKRDVWQHKNLLPVNECDDEPGRDFIPYQYVGRKNCLAKLRTDGKKITDFLAYYRSMIINHYHILVTSVRYDSRSEQLYKLFYRELEKIGFPPLHKPLKPRKNYRKLSWPADFEDRIQTAMHHLETEDKLKIVFPRINNYLDMALLSALKANSAALQQLGKDIHFHPASPLMLLTADERLWQKAEEEYSYLTPVIDFSGVKQTLEQKRIEKQRKNAKIKKFSNYVAIGFGVLGLANTVRLPPLLRKRHLTASLAWLVAGGILTYNELSDFIRNGAKINNMINGYFGNGRDNRDVEELHGALQTRRRDKQSLILSLLLLGADLAFLNKLTKVFSRLYVKITRDNRIRDGADVIASRLKTKVANNYRTLKSTMGNFKDRFYANNPHIERALQFLGKTWGVPRKVLDRTLYRIVPRSRLEEIIKKRFDDPHFFPHLVNVTSVSLFHLTLTEWGLYRDSIKYNLDRIAIDYISSIFFSVMLTWINFGHTPTALKPFRTIFKKQRKDLNFKMLKDTTLESAGLFRKHILNGMSVGFIGTLPAVSMVELSQLHRGEKTSKEALRNIMAMSIFGTAYIATISNIRAQLLREVRTVWAREDIHFILNNANSLFGQWIWIRLKDASGAYKKSGPVDEERHYLIKRVRKEGERSHLFDFMNDIESPAVSLNLPDRIEQNFIE